MTSYWLSEPSPPLPETPGRRSGGRRRRRWRHRLRGGAPARRGGQARAALRRPRGRRGSKRPQRRLRAARHAGRVRRHRRVGRRGRARELMAWTESAIDTIESLAGRFVPARRLAPDRGRRGGARRAAHRVRGARRGRLRGRVDRRLRAAARGPLHGGAPPRPRRRAPAGALGAAARRRSPPAAGVEIREHTRVASLDELGGATVVVCTDGYPSGLLGRDRGADHPDARAGDRDRAGSRALFEVPTTVGTASTTGTSPRTGGSSPAASATCRSTRSSPPTSS